MFWRVRRDPEFMIAVTDHLPFSHYDYLKIGHMWSEVPAKGIDYKLDIESGLPIPNIFPTSLHPVLLMDDRAFNTLSYLFLDHENIFYDGNIDGRHLNIVACITKVCGFDYNRSEYERYELAPPKDEIRKISKLRLRHNLNTKHDIFRLADEWALEFELIASDRFKSAYETGGLTGLRFVAAS